MNIKSISRRTLLKSSVAFGGLVATSCFIYNSSSPINAVVKSEFGVLLVLNEVQASVISAFCDVILPKGNGFPDAIEAEVIQRLDEELFFVSLDISEELKSALNTLEWLPLAYNYMSRFTKLSLIDRRALLSELESTRLDSVRALISSIRIICFNIYYGHKSTWSSIEYDGPFSGIQENLGDQRRYYSQLIDISEG